MFLTLFTVLRRTMHLYQEIDRRAVPRKPFANRRSLRRSATLRVAWRTISITSS
jgi:hypothetical protein